MDNQTAKEILSAYRPNGQDSDDPLFQEALRHCESDPEMKQWLQEERSFDRAMIQAMKDIPAPREQRDHLLQTSALIMEKGLDAKPGRKLFLPSLWAIAAVLVLGLLVWQAIPKQVDPAIFSNDFTLSQLISQAMPLSYRNDDPEEVLAWLASQEAPVPDEFPGGLAGASALGCRIFTLPEGGQISLLCMMKNGELVHFFVFDESTKSLMAYAPENTWWEENGWHMFTFTKGDNQIALASQGNTSVLL